MMMACSFSSWRVQLGVSVYFRNHDNLQDFFLQICVCVRVRVCVCKLLMRLCAFFCVCVTMCNFFTEFEGVFAFVCVCMCFVC